MTFSRFHPHCGQYAVLTARTAGAPHSGQAIEGMELGYRIPFSARADKPYIVSMAALLDVCGLSVELPAAGGWVRPVNDVSLRIEAGEALGLVGESGGGKTMLSLAL